MDKINALYNSERFLSIVFLLWLATMPFGAFVGSLSLGVMTIYPNLIVTIFLLPLCVVTFLKWTKLQWAFVVIVALLLIHCIVWGLLNGFNKNAIFDTRSVLFYLLFTMILFSIYTSRHWEILRSVLVKGIRYYFIIVLVAGIIELFTGVHLVGSFTDKLATQPVNGNFYAPIFIYDNPNTYLTYFVGLFGLMILVDTKLRANFWLKIAVLLVMLIFAFYASSRFVVMISCGWIIVELLSQVKAIQFSKAYLWIFAGVLGGALLLAKHSFFLGPKYGSQTQKFVVNELDVVIDHGDSLSVRPARALFPEERYSELVDAYYRAAGPFSDDLRKNLVLNGWEFIKERPVFGIGPGQYREYLDQGRGKYETDTLRSPHNYVIEMWSQYGLLAVVYFVFFAVILLKLLTSKISWADKKSYLLVFIAFGILMMVPSGFLLLDINWLFMPIVLIATQVMQAPKSSEIHG